MNQTISHSKRSSVNKPKWQQHIAAQQVSGLSQSAYCKIHDLNAKYFSLWKSKLKKVAPAVAPDSPPSTFIPVVIKNKATPSVAIAPSSPSAFTLKATLANGIAIDLCLPTEAAFYSALAQLAKMPC
jgi:hypothetical protein